jgi:hypothetical protein
MWFMFFLVCELCERVHTRLSSLFLVFEYVLFECMTLELLKELSVGCTKVPHKRCDP